MAEITLGDLLATPKPQDIQSSSVEATHTLDELASDIRAFSGSILFSAIEIGRRMVEAKKMLPHGEFGKWVKEKTGYSQTKANNFMRMFREYGSDQNGIFGAGANYHTYGNLSYSNALALLDLPSDERDSFVQENNVVDMTSRELDKAIRERKEALAAAEEAKADAKAAEDARAKMEADMTMLKGLLESAKAEAATATDDASRLARELEDLKSKPVDVAVMQVDQEAIDKARAEAVAGMQDKLDRAQKARDKANEKLYATEKALQEMKEKLEAETKARKQALLNADSELVFFQSLQEQAIGIINQMKGSLIKARRREDQSVALGMQKIMIHVGDYAKKEASE